MNFINPFVLFGLLAAGIPVLLHLLNLRKLKTVEFSSLKFLKELQKTKIRKLKLKQILLLILRTLIIIFAVLAFARPTIPGSLPYFESYSKTSAIILIDNSFSMDISDEGGNRFNQAKTAVQNIITSMNDGDEIALITMSGNTAEPTFSRNFEYISEKIKSLKILHTPANLNTGLRIAESIINDASNPNRELYVISDAQSNIFKILNNDTVRLKSAFSSLIFVPVGLNSKADLQNLSVDSINVISAIFQQDKLVETEAFIRNGSKNPISDVVVSLKFNGKPVAQRSADINPGETKSFAISAQPGESGPISAVIELESDIQDYDNFRYFGFNIPPKPRLLVIGNQTPNPYIKASLLPLSSDENQANIRYINTSRLSSEDFSNYNALIITEGILSKSDLDRLTQYINYGGSVLFFANEDSENDLVFDFLKNNGIGKVNEKSFPANNPVNFLNVDKNHPIFEGVFDNKPGTSQIETPKIIKAMPSESGLALISMPGGAFMSESKRGEGKIIYIAVSPTSEWSNFPFTGIFPTLIYRNILYLTSSEDISTNIKVGESLMFKIPNKFISNGTFKILDPNGNEFFVQSAKLPQGNVVNLENLMIAGVYRIFDEKNNYVAQIAVNSDESESLINRNDESKITNELKYRFDKTPIEIISNIQDLSTGISRVRTGTELWQIFILLAIITAVIEMIVQRISKNEVEV
jgi:hypothetical protein